MNEDSVYRRERRQKTHEEKKGYGKQPPGLEVPIRQNADGMGGEDTLEGRLFGTEWAITSFVPGNCE